MDLLTGKEGKLDQDSIDALQIILHKIDNQPEKVSPAIREFAEEATKTLKIRTNVDLPRRPPWLVSARGAFTYSYIAWPNLQSCQKDFQRGEKVDEGKNSAIYKAIWKKGGMEVVLKDLRDCDKIEVRVCQYARYYYEVCPQGLVEDIVRWRDLEHPFLHTFLGAQPIGKPRFFVYKYMRYGNVLDYLKYNRLANKELLVSLSSIDKLMRAKFTCPQLLQMSLGMEYLHRSSMIHGNIRVRIEAILHCAALMNE